MKYAGLLWSALSKRMFRTVLTLLSITIAFVLFGILHGVTAAIDHVMFEFPATQLSVFSSIEQQPLPSAYGPQIAQLPFVQHVDEFSPFIAYFREPSNRILAMALGDAAVGHLPQAVCVSTPYAAALAATRTGAIVDHRLAQKYGWKIGDKIPLHSTVANHDGSTVWIFDLVGFYEVPKHSIFGGLFYFRHDYLDEGRLSGAGTTGGFLVYTADALRNADVEAAIDGRFANSSAPTKTQTEMEGYREASGEAIDFDLLATCVLGATLFTLLLITANTMMESVRQRSSELAILKTIGFSNQKLLTLVFLEAFTLYALGGVLGLSMSRLFFPFIGPVDTTLEPLPLPGKIYLEGAAIATMATILSAAIPAIRALRLSIVDGLRLQ